MLKPLPLLLIFLALIYFCSSSQAQFCEDCGQPFCGPGSVCPTCRERRVMLRQMYLNLPGNRMRFFFDRSQSMPAGGDGQWSAGEPIAEPNQCPQACRDYQRTHSWNDRAADLAPVSENVGEVLSEQAWSSVAVSPERNDRLQNTAKAMLRQPGIGRRNFTLVRLAESLSPLENSAVQALLDQAGSFPQSQVIAIAVYHTTQEMLIIFGTAHQSQVVVTLVNTSSGTSVIYTIPMSLSDLMNMILTEFRFNLYITNSIQPAPEHRDSEADKND